MKRAIVVFLILIVIGIAFYIGFYQSKSAKTASSTFGENALAINPTQNKEQLSPRDTAVNFSQACAAGDWDKAYAYYPMRDDKQKELLKDYLGGMEIISIGEPYKKFPSYAGMHIPYEIKLKSREIKKYDLAVRNDNPAKVWIIDGGI